MNNIDILVKKYKHKITPGEKSVEKLIDFLKGKVDIEEIAITELMQSIIQSITYNVIHSLRNQELNLTAGELIFFAYKLSKSNKNSPYYQLDFANLSKDPEKDMIYVVFEKKTGVIHSNCNKLLKELFIEQGVSQYDYDNETSLLYGYLHYLDSYFQGHY